LPDLADGVATRREVPAERRTDVADHPLERAVNLKAPGSLNEVADVVRPYAAGRQDFNATTRAVNQPGEKFKFGRIHHHPRDAKVDELFERIERISNEVKGAMEDDTGCRKVPETLHIDFERGGQDADCDFAIDPIQVAEHDRQLRLTVTKVPGPGAKHGHDRQARPLSTDKDTGRRRQAIDFQRSVQFQPVGTGQSSSLRISRGGNGNLKKDSWSHAILALPHGMTRKFSPLMAVPSRELGDRRPS
jgi:hypothetical protein